jgi:hypothetical protein
VIWAILDQHLIETAVTPTRIPDFLPNGEDTEDHSQLFQESTSGWRFHDSSLNIEDERIDIGEVVSPPSVPIEKPDIDIFFCAPLKELKALLLKVYAEEPPNPAKNTQLEQRDDMWWIQGRLFVPQKLCPRILKEYHDSPLSGHLGLLKALDTISQTMTWPQIRKDVLIYTKSCFFCQCSKHSNQ